jgi:putative transposase
VSWDGRNWEIVNVGETVIGLLSDRNLAELPIVAFEKLIRENRAQMLPVDRDPDADRAVCERLSQASEADLQTASHRSGLISQYVEFRVLPASDVVPARTFFRWLGLYRKAEAAYGTGFVGLLPQSSGRGNGTAKLPETSRRLMQESMLLGG